MYRDNKYVKPSRPPADGLNGKENMENSVKVTIERKDDRVIVSNNFGATWEFINKDFQSKDHSLNGAIADIAGAMLTGTIVSHLEELTSPKIAYTLTIKTE